ncbi:hypothetical protein L7F22_055082 [Adiantum nelumboides]|nr:hypothetical protein [Adiantum nelumboides]
MGSPAHISIPSSAPSSSSPGASPSETESSLSSSSPSFPASSSSSSFMHRDSPSFASSSSDNQTRQEIKNRQRKNDLLEGHMVDNDTSHVPKCTCTKSINKGSKRALMGSCKRCKMGVSMRKSCCRCAGAFAADCAALCCCPCAIVSLLGFVVVELPAALARRLITQWKKRLSVKNSAESNRDDSLSISTLSRSRRELCKEPCTGAEAHAVRMIRFDTENLLKHFDAEHVGFGCLSQKKD